MPRLNKLRKKQKFKYDRNRSRMRKTQEKHMSKHVKITCEVIKEEWDSARPVKTNMTRMGLVYDANRAIKSRSIKEKMVANLKRIKDDDEGEDEEEPHAQVEESEVVRKLRADVASYEKKNNFRLPAEDVRWVTEMMDKHGDDFKAMARDPQNLFQLTPKQIRQKVAKFISTKGQFERCASDRGMLEDAQKIKEDGD